jgi:hypothetical protein
MRAQVAPSAGNLRRAESIIQAMEAAGSLRRRYVTVGDAVETLWSSKPEAPAASSSGPVFGHIAAKAKATPTTQPLDLGEVKMTWDKFRRTLLNDAESIEYNVPSSPVQLAALVTAVDASAPPILQWDGGTDGKRNPVSVYSSTSAPSTWNLTPGAWVPVDFVSPMPYHWNGNAAANQKEGILMALRGCRDVKRTSGGGFLPEFLRSELREIRSSLDAYARSARVEGADKAAACGIALMKTADVAGGVRAASTSTATNVILVFDESGSMSSHSRNIHLQAEAIRSQLAATMPSAMVTVIRFGAMVIAEPRTTASRLSPLRFHANMGGTALYDALATASRMATNAADPTLVYLITDGEENQSRLYNSDTCTEAVLAALSTGRVSFGCVGPAQAAGFFRSAGIPSACVRDWYGGGSDLAAVTAEVSKGIAAFADARAAGLSAIEDFFSAPVSG